MSKLKKTITAIVSAVTGAVLAVGVSAVDSTVVDPSAIVSALSDFNVGNVTAVIVAGLGIAVPLVLIWFAFRWVYRKAKGALMSGR